MFVVRPAAIFLATIGAGLELKERILVAWIAPRGIVAVAVSGLFGSALLDLGIEDGNRMTALTFSVVASTIILHGFSLGPLARLLGLKSAARQGVLIVGGSTWTEALAEKLKENDIPTLIADSNYNHIRKARLADLPVYFGEVLSESAHHDITFNRYSHLIAATDNDAYNALVCTEFGPELGRSNVFQIGNMGTERERQALHFTLGGKAIFEPKKDFSELRSKIWSGWGFQGTKLSDEFSFSDYLDTRCPETQLILWAKPNGNLIFRNVAVDMEPKSGDLLIAFGPGDTKS